MGDNFHLGDRDGVRTPMQWNVDRNGGFSRADPGLLTTPMLQDPVYGYMSVNVESQERQQSSLLNWMRRLIALRKKYTAFGRGTMEIVAAENRSVLAFIRKYEGQILLCVNNLSQHPQPVALDLSAYVGCQPVELFGNSHFPPIREEPYFLSLGSNDFYWFLLECRPGSPD
jgi:maltose alpha-D-glucosyltransferase/alpha-amylase